MQGSFHDAPAACTSSKYPAAAQCLRGTAFDRNHGSFAKIQGSFDRNTGLFSWRTCGVRESQIPSSCTMFGWCSCERIFASSRNSFKSCSDHTSICFTAHSAPSHEPYVCANVYIYIYTYEYIYSPCLETLSSPAATTHLSGSLRTPHPATNPMYARMYIYIYIHMNIYIRLV